MNGFSKPLAFALVRAWQADAWLSRLDNELLSEMYAKVKGGGFFLREMKARTFFPTFSRQANEYVWDNKFQSAAKWLMKYGAEKEDSGSLRRVKQEVKYNEKRAKAVKNDRNELYASHRASNQWGVCK